MSQNKILKDIAIKLGATVGEHVNDTNELLTAIAVALGATPTKKYNNVKDTLELIRDNISEGGSGGSGSEITLKKVLNRTKSARYLFANYSGDDLGNLIQFYDTTNVTNFSNMYSQCTKATIFPAIYTYYGINFTDMYFNCYKATSVPALNTYSGTNFANMYNYCQAIPKIDITRFTSSGANTSAGFCKDCCSLKAIIIRSFGSSYSLASDAFSGCCHLLGITHSTYNPKGKKDGYIYIPRDMISTLKTATNWSTYASQLRALEDYTVDGTTTGEFDDEKAGLI